MPQDEYRIISGVAYPHLISGKNVTDLIRANIHDRDAYYYDDAVRLSEHDVQEMKNLVGHPLCVEHNENIQVGKITHSWTDKEGQLRFMARLNLGTKAGRMASEALDRGELSGISVGYQPDIDFETMRVRGKQFREISLCRQGFFPGAQVSVRASDSSKLADEHYKSNPDLDSIIFYKITAHTDKTAATMSEENAAATAGQESVEKKTPPSPPPLNDDKESQELARQTDEMIRRNEELQARLEKTEAENKEKEARLALLEKKDQERREKYEAEKAAELKKILEINKQQYKDVFGEEAELPKEYETSASNAFKFEEAAPQMQAITASALAYQKQKEQNEELMKRLAEMEGQVKKLSADHKVAMTHVAATRRRVFKNDEELEDKPSAEQDSKMGEVTASTGGFDQLFMPTPSKEELELYQRDYGTYNAGAVTASGTKGDQRKIVTLPEHPHVDQLKNSMRFSHPHIFTHLVTMDRASQPTIPLQHTYQRL